jgi:hypothetical protein
MLHLQHVNINSVHESGVPQGNGGSLISERLTLARDLAPAGPIRLVNAIFDLAQAARD